MTARTMGFLLTLAVSSCGGGQITGGEATGAEDRPAETDLGTCGDGHVEPRSGEGCDDGAGNSNELPDACRLDCKPARCGDGVADSLEACDDGAGNSNELPDACRLDCKPARCGDGVADSLEACDDGAGNSNELPDACRLDCKLARCGDGVADSLEACDDGAGNSNELPDACRLDCKPARCGDGVTDSREACDDGNQDDNDGCASDCTIGGCGSGSGAISNGQLCFAGAAEDRALVDALVEQHLSVREPKRIIYVAPLSGSTDGSGATREDPRRNLKAALEAALPGDHFHLAPGVYRIDDTRDTFGMAGSLIILRNSGTREDKIVVRTDPELWDPRTGAVAQIDFGFDNSQGSSDPHSIGLYADHWVLQGLEIRNFNYVGIFLSGKYNLIRDCEIHHGNHEGQNNTGLIVIGTGGAAYDLIMNNHLHHSGNLDGAGNLIGTHGGENGGCAYSVTRQAYTSGWRELVEDNPNPSWEEVEAVTAPPDSEVYYYNNFVHHCHGNGIATKNVGVDGPFYLLSNVIHTAENGIKITLSHSLVRNNVVFAGEWMNHGLLVGWNTASSIRPQIKNAVGITIEQNTFAGPPVGIAHRAGWNGLIRNNLFVDVVEPHQMIGTYYAWHPNEPWVIGEYAYGDLTPEHPHYLEMPIALQSRVGHYFRLQAVGNVYSVEPLITTKYSSNGPYELKGTTLSNDHTVLGVETIKAHMRAPQGGDYRRSLVDPGPLEGIGSAIR